MESQGITSPKASRTISLPKHEAKGMGIVDNRQEAIVQSKMIGNIKRQAFREIPNRNKAMRSDNLIQCKGEAEALANITTDESGTGGDKREMSRGNAFDDVVKTMGKSRLWVSLLRRETFKTMLENKICELYQEGQPFGEEFKVWYDSRKVMIEGLVYKYIGSGNCGEFASALYGELQQNTSNQYIYHASWMWKPSADTPAIDIYRKANPGVFIKAEDADHAFVVTYPELLPSEDFRYTSEVKIKNPPSEGIPIYRVARHKIAGIQYRDQAMVADGWLDRKVKTMNQTGLTDENTLLSNPQKAGENILSIDMRQKIADWAEELKVSKEDEDAFKSDAAKVISGGQNPRLYTNDSNWEAEPKDIRPIFVKVFHGVPTEQVQNLIAAWDGERELLIEFTKHTKSELIEELGKQVVADGNRYYFFVFLQLLNASGVTGLRDRFIQGQLTALTTLVTQLEVHVGRDTLDNIYNEVKALYNSIPQENCLQFEYLVRRVKDILKLHRQLLCFKKLLSQLEGQIGVLAFEKTFDIMREQYNLIPQENRSQFEYLVHRANDISKLHSQLPSFEKLLSQLEGQIGVLAFEKTFDLMQGTYNLILQENSSQFNDLVQRVNDILKLHNQYLELESLVEEMNDLIGKPDFMVAYGKYERLYNQISVQNDNLYKDNLYKIADRAILAYTKHLSSSQGQPKSVFRTAGLAITKH